MASGIRTETPCADLPQSMSLFILSGQHTVTLDGEKPMHVGSGDVFVVEARLTDT
jgi:uncharacterized cupin superfamily protein